jgi:hypothetical protein
MPNALLSKLGARYGELAQRYDAILDRCGREDRSPNSSETETLTQLRSDMGALTERVVELRDDEDRRHAAMTALTDIPDLMGGAPYSVVGDQGPVVPLAQGGPTGLLGMQTRAQPPELCPSEQQVRSLMAAIADHTGYNEPIQLRADITRPAGAVVPDWLHPGQLVSGREDRIASLLTNDQGSGTQASWLEVVGPAVVDTVAEGAAKPDAGTGVDAVSAAFEKYAGYSPVTSEMASDFAGSMALIQQELVGAVISKENAEISAMINTRG